MSERVSSSDPISEVLSSIVGPVWLQVGRMFGGTDHTVIPDAHIVYDSDGIRHAGVETPSRNLIRMGQEKPDLHLPNHTILPGLTDAHTHLFLAGGETDPAKRAAYHDELRATVDDPAKHLAYVMKSSMIQSLRDLEAVA